MEDIFISDSELDTTLHLLKSKYKTDFSEYARTSLKRRVARIKKLLLLDSLDDLDNFLAVNPDNVKLFVMEITVNTTEMFRDPDFWRYLRTTLLPELAANNTIRIWHAGCSSGEEAVSMAILLHELDLLGNSKIYATDINEFVLERSANGCYRIKDFEQAQANYIQAGGSRQFSSYFHFANDHFCLRNEFRSAFHFKKHNLAKDSAFTKVDLVLCRNVMIYFSAQLQSRAVRTFAKSLFKGGYLAIGEKENIAFLEEMKLFTHKNDTKKIYRVK